MPRLLANLLLLVLLLGAPATLVNAADLAGPINLWLPGQDWAVRVDGKTYVVTEREVSLGSRSTRFFGEDRGRRVLVSGFIEPASRDGDATVVRQVLLDSLKRSPQPPDGIATWERDGFAYAQYSAAVGGLPGFRQTSVHVYAVHGRHWIDIHFSSMDPKVDLRELTASVSIVPDYKPSEQDRAAATEPIKRLEGQLSSPENASETKWKALAARVAMAYAEAGQPGDARRVLRRGLARYPGYAVFHYSLACADAEQGDVESAIANLRIAWRNREALAPHEQLPDPLQSRSFAAILKDPRYRQMVVDITQPR